MPAKVIKINAPSQEPAIFETHVLSHVWGCTHPSAETFCHQCEEKKQKQQEREQWQ